MGSNAIGDELCDNPGPVSQAVRLRRAARGQRTRHDLAEALDP